MGLEDKSGRSNHLEPHQPGITDWSGGNNSDSHPGDINGSWHSEHLEIIPELIGGSGTSMHSETPPLVTDRSGSIDHFCIKPIVMEGNRRTNPFETISEVAGENEKASSEDLFQVDAELGNLESHTQPSKDEEINVSSMPPTQSPPRQVMDFSGQYDPLRIPSAIFERSTSLTPQEWSAASNESLFSIHIGNNSFSRDQFKSGELAKIDELIMFNPSPTIPEVGADTEVAEFEKSDATRGAVKNTMNAPKKTIVEPSVNVLQSSHSNESSRSFAFPIREKKRCCACGCIPFFCCRKKCKRKKCAWPSCYCSNCSCTFCYFRWPSCYCWNCSQKRWCCHSSTTLTDRVKSFTVKPDVAEKRKKKPLSPKETLKSSSSCCWFSCLSCRPCSCSFSCFHCFYCCGCCRCRK